MAVEIDFNIKYQDLFRLLDSWSVTKDPDFKKDYSKKEQKYWKSLARVDTVLVYGGRESSKTFPISCFATVAAKDYGHRVMFTRYTMASTDYSISKSIASRMDLMDCYDDFNDTKNHYTSKEGKGEIVITGQKTSSNKQTAKMKGIEDFTIFITDEGEELPDFGEWDKARKSFRGKDLQCLSIIVMNPPSKEHFTFEKFFKDLGIAAGFTGIVDGTMYIHTTYLDNWDNLTEHTKRDYEAYRVSYEEYQNLSNSERDVNLSLKRRYRYYKHVVLGGFRDKAEGVIYEDWRYGEFNDQLTCCYGMDFGFKDPDVMVKIAVDHPNKLIHVHQEINLNGLGTDELSTIIKDRAGSGLVVGDSAHPRLISDLYNKNVNIVACRKGQGSVVRTINTVREYTLVLTPESTDVAEALDNYVWHDKRGEVPMNEYKHFPDAIGYGSMEIMYI